MDSPLHRNEYDKLMDMNFKEYIMSKLIMLRQDFKFKLTPDEVFAIEHAENEDKLDRIVHDLFKKYL